MTTYGDVTARRSVSVREDRRPGKRGSPVRTSALTGNPPRRDKMATGSLIGVTRAGVV